MPETQTTQTTQAPDPMRNFQFRLEIPGVARGHFTEVSGLGVRVHPIRYREGGIGQIVRTLPGPVDYSEVTLRYGLIRDAELWNWMQGTIQGRVERRNVSIMMLETDGTTESLRWNLFNAWPCEWQGAPLDALGRDVAVELLRLSFDQLERV